MKDCCWLRPGLRARNSLAAFSSRPEGTYFDCEISESDVQSEACWLVLTSGALLSCTCWEQPGGVSKVRGTNLVFVCFEDLPLALQLQ